MSLGVVSREEKIIGLILEAMTTGELERLLEKISLDFD